MLCIRRFGRQPEAFGVVISVSVGIAYPKSAGAAFVSLVGDGGTAGHEIETRIYIAANISEMIASVGIKLYLTIIGTALLIEKRNTVFICLIGFDKVLRGEEESVALPGASRTCHGVEEIAPVDASDSAGTVVF